MIDNPVSERQQPLVTPTAPALSAVNDTAGLPARPRRGRKLPSGHHRFSREFVVQSQRERMLDAVARAVAGKGYEKASVADVLTLAGVSRRTFYEQFTGKEHCFLVAYQTIFADLLAASWRAYSSRRRWPDRIGVALEAFVAPLAAEPAYARAGIIEVLAAGPRAIELRDELLRGFYPVFDARRPEVPDHGAPRIVAEATVGGIYEVIYRHILAHGPQSLLDLLPELTYLALAPFIGSRAATRAARLDGARLQPGV